MRAESDRRLPLRPTARIADRDDGCRRAPRELRLAVGRRPRRRAGCRGRRLRRRVAERPSQRRRPRRFARARVLDGAVGSGRHGAARDARTSRAECRQSRCGDLGGDGRHPSGGQRWPAVARRRRGRWLGHAVQARAGSARTERGQRFPAPFSSRADRADVATGVVGRGRLPEPDAAPADPHRRVRSQDGRPRRAAR